MKKARSETDLALREQDVLESVRRFVQPFLRNWLEAASNSIELWRLDHGGGNGDTEGTSRGLETDGLEVRFLRAVLVRGLVLPTLRVLVSNVLCFGIALFARYLTDLRHDFTGCLPTTTYEGTQSCGGESRSMRKSWSMA